MIKEMDKLNEQNEQKMKLKEEEIKKQKDDIGYLKESKVKELEDAIQQF